MSSLRVTVPAIGHDTTVLVVETDASVLTTRILLFKQSGFRVVSATGYIELLELERTVSIDVAVLSESLGATVLDKTTRFIRRQWPRGRILIIGHRGIEIDDQQYDEAMDHQFHPEKLIDAIFKQSSYGS